MSVVECTIQVDVSRATVEDFQNSKLPLGDKYNLAVTQARLDDQESRDIRWEIFKDEVIGPMLDALRRVDLTHFDAKSSAGALKLELRLHVP